MLYRDSDDIHVVFYHVAAMHNYEMIMVMVIMIVVLIIDNDDIEDESSPPLT